jgi:putative Mg2+ transporter-C (MgtC) family protein
MIGEVTMNEYVMVVRMVLAALLGGAVGIEREIHDKAAGFRTHILVCLGSCMIMLTSMHISDMYHGITNADPGRIAAQVVSGIGFLGAGTIIRARASIIGLTTAASLWSIAGVGLAIGSGLYIVGATGTAIMLISLVLMSRFEADYLHRKK